MSSLEKVLLLVTKKIAQTVYSKFKCKKQSFWNTNSGEIRN